MQTEKQERQGYVIRCTKCGCNFPVDKAFFPNKMTFIYLTCPKCQDTFSLIGRDAGSLFPESELRTSLRPQETVSPLWTFWQG